MQQYYNETGSDNITVKTANPNTKGKLGVTALIAIMEPGTESQSSRALL
jgi:hypothetical protein